VATEPFDVVEPVHHGLPPALEQGIELLGELLLDVEHLGKGILRRGGRTGHQLVLHLRDVVDQVQRCGQVAESPSWDREGLGEGVEHDRSLYDLIEGVVLTLVDEILVHLVGDHPQVIIGGQVHQRLEVLPRQHRTGGVGRGVHHQASGPGGDQGLHGLDVGLEAVLIEERIWDGLCLHEHAVRLV